MDRIVGSTVEGSDQLQLEKSLAKYRRFPKRYKLHDLGGHQFMHGHRAQASSDETHRYLVDIEPRLGGRLPEGY